MPRKPATNNDSSAGAAPARSAKPKAPRVKSAKHAKAAPHETGLGDAQAAAEPVIEVNVVEEVNLIESALIPEPAVVAEPVVIIAAGENTSDSSGGASAEMDVSPSAQSDAQLGGDAREEIARIAYSFWQARGCGGGDPLEDWVRAENEYRRLHAI